MLLDDFLALLGAGLSHGAIYAMVGLGIGIAYKPTNVFNLAHGEFVMLGAMFGWLFMTDAAWPWAVAVLAILGIVGLLGLVEERTAVAPHLKASGHSHGWLISTLAVSIIIINASDQFFGSDPRSVPPLPGTSNIQFYTPLALTTHQFGVIAIAVASVLTLEYVYRRTLIGKAISAVAEDRDGARLNGISPLRLTLFSFGIATAFAAFSGLVAAPILLASTTLGTALLIKGFMALALGGVNSSWGTLAAGALIGCFESISSYFLSNGSRQLLLLGLILLILLLRPQGLFGGQITRKV